MNELIKLCDSLPENTLIPMEYKNSHELKPLAAGTFLGYPYLIISNGTHPCCYVQVPKGHEYYGKEWEDIDILCHGGITFSQTNTDCWIGWDYAHVDDQYGADDFILNRKGKKWTTEEMLEEIKNVINQLKALEVIEGEVC